MANETETRAWSGDPADYSDEEYRRACVLDRGADFSDNVKERFGLPVRDPDGTLNCDGVAAAQRRIGQVEGASEEALAAARSKLERLAAECQQGSETPSEGRTRPQAGTLETRASEVAVEGKRIRGIVPFNIESRDMGGWREVISPLALRSTNLDELVARVDHAGVPIGRYPKTLTLEERGDGLHWSVVPPESRADVREAIERGDLRSASWQMVVAKDRWAGDVRHVEQISELRDVSVVSSPAYPAAAVEYRSAPIQDQEDKMSEDNSTSPEPAEEARSEDNQETGARADDAPKSKGRLEVRDRTIDGLGAEVRFIRELAEFAQHVPKGESRALSTTVSLSNPQYGSDLIDLLRPRSVFLQSGVQVLTTSSDSVIYPVLTTDATNSWTSEGGTITESDPVFNAGTVTPHKLAVRVEYSNEVADDSVPGLESVLRSALAARAAIDVDVAAFEGIGASPIPAGMGTVAGTVFNTYGGADLRFAGSAITYLESNAASRPFAYVVTPNYAHTLRDLRVGINGTADEWLFPVGNDAMPNLWGAAGYIAPHLADGTAYMYAPSDCYIVNRTSGFDIEIDRSRLFHTDSSEMRLKARLDLFFPHTGSITRGTGIS